MTTSRDEFIRALTERLDKGAAQYGDRSFDRPVDQLLAELQQEALDLAGWGFVLWERVRRDREAVAWRGER